MRRTPNAEVEPVHRARSRVSGCAIALALLVAMAMLPPASVASPPFRPPSKHGSRRAAHLGSSAARRPAKSPSTGAPESEEAEASSARSARSKPAATPAADAATVERVRYQADAQSTRVIVLLSRSVPYEVSVLPGERSRGSERRVVVDLSNAKLGHDAQAPIGIEDGLLKQIRTGQFTARTARVVLDLASVTGHHVTALDDPPRIVVDIEGKPTAANAREGKAGESASQAAPTPEAAPGPGGARDHGGGHADVGHASEAPWRASRSPPSAGASDACPTSACPPP